MFFFSPEFSNSVGMPVAEGLSLVHAMLVGAGLRDRVRVVAAGKVLTGFSLVKMMALGADVCNSARAMMFALGCIQALKCNTNKCPTGITTQDPTLMAGLRVPYKSDRYITLPLSPPLPVACLRALARSLLAPTPPGGYQRY